MLKFVRVSEEIGEPYQIKSPEYRNSGGAWCTSVRGLTEEKEVFLWLGAVVPPPR